MVKRVSRDRTAVGIEKRVIVTYPDDGRDREDAVCSRLVLDNDRFAPTQRQSLGVKRRAERSPPVPAGNEVMIFTPRSGQTSASDDDGAMARLPKQTTTAPNVLATAECMINSSSARFTPPFFEEEAR